MEDTFISSLREDLTGTPQLTPESADYLLKAAKWGKFLAILGFIITGLLVFAGIIMGFVMSSVQDEMNPVGMSFSPVLFSVIYVVFAAIYIIPVIFLNSFSNNAIRAVSSASTENLTVSLHNLKKLFAFVGISTIVVLAIYTVVLISVGIAAMFSF